MSDSNTNSRPNTSNAIYVIENVLKRTLQNSDGSENTYFVGCLTSDVIKDLTYVSAYPREANTDIPWISIRLHDGGYQRTGEEKRMGEFAEFIKTHPNSIVPPVILSTGDHWVFAPYKNSTIFGELHVIEEASIMDGQHRIAGYSKQFIQDNVPRIVEFIAIHGMDLAAESRAFSVINDNTSKVSKSLLATQRAILDDGEYENIALSLDSDDDSVFMNKIAHQKLTKDFLFTLDTVSKNAERTFKHTSLIDIDRSKKVAIMKGYWREISKLHPEEWSDINLAKKDMQYKLLENTGLVAWSLVAPQILSQCVVENGYNMNWAKVNTLIARTVERIDWRKKGGPNDPMQKSRFEGQTGEMGGGQIKLLLERMIDGQVGNNNPTV